MPTSYVNNLATSTEPRKSLQPTGMFVYIPLSTCAFIRPMQLKLEEREREQCLFVLLVHYRTQIRTFRTQTTLAPLVTI